MPNVTQPSCNRAFPCLFNQYLDRPQWLWIDKGVFGKWMDGCCDNFWKWELCSAAAAHTKLITNMCREMTPTGVHTSHSHTCIMTVSTEISLWVKSDLQVDEYLSGSSFALVDIFFLDYAHTPTNACSLLPPCYKQLHLCNANILIM